jgi:uncharacterized phage protein (TIGR02220 family)
MRGWFKFYRELFEKPIWITSTPEQKTILMTLLGMANFKENEWEFKGQKYTIKPGQCITSLESIVDKCGKGVTLQNVRTALKRFEKYEFLTNESTNKNRLITIVNWEFYQGGDEEPNKQDNKQLTSNQQATNKQLTTNKNVNKDNNGNNEINKDIIVDIIDYLNNQADKKYKHSTDKTKKLIQTRLNDGFTLDDFKKVIDNKVITWKGNPEMDLYLRPETLFGTKFEGYLNEKPNNGQAKPGKGVQGGKNTAAEDWANENGLPF